MSNYFEDAIHPRTGEVKRAAFLDDYFGPRQYGVRFDGEEHVYRASEIPWRPDELERDMTERVQFDDAGELDEVVTNGGAHLERMTERSWFLNCIREDGSSFAVWIEGRVTLWEERQKPKVTP